MPLQLVQTVQKKKKINQEKTNSQDFDTSLYHMQANVYEQIFRSKCKQEMSL